MIRKWIILVLVLLALAGCANQYGQSLVVLEDENHLFDIDPDNGSGIKTISIEGVRGEDEVEVLLNPFGWVKQESELTLEVRGIPNVVVGKVITLKEEDGGWKAVIDFHTWKFVEDQIKEAD